MEDNKILLENELCDDSNPCECDDCMKLSLEDSLSDDFDQLWDDEDAFEVCETKKRCDKKKCIIIAAVAGAIIAVAAVVIYSLLKKRNTKE